ncbi:hypothetical protein [Nonomuraea sp. MG754425]|uniref:DUF7507 domain-containing protein n=1 Tax=Nonomuraea sp. MG754425 TaxID=2570319 RepID=UPI001F479E90|nr:hypothetical protein [Nonomuraea sp. MG754425]
MAPLAQPAAAQPVGVPLVDETFTGAEAIAGFEAFGPACLTGAPQAPATGPGTHPLTGCPAGASGPVPPDDAAPYGYLRLTDASNDQSAAVLYNHALPANQGLVVTFDQWQYGGTTNPPADGISFFLIDGAASLTAPGAFGGSLGYAQKQPDDNPDATFLPGVNRGYVGVGLDVLGNYFGDWEHRGNGCADRSPAGTVFRVPAPGANMVTVRGPGDDIDGYCFLDATTSNFSTTGPWPSTLPGELHGPTTEVPADATPQEAEALLAPSRRTVTVEVSPAPDPLLTVLIDFHDGNGAQQVLSTPAPRPVPSTYKFGFAASTGLFTDVHLIRNLTVHPAAALPQLNLVKQVSQAPPPPTPLTPGTRVPFEYVLTNTGGVPMTNVTVTDDRVTEIICPQNTLAVGETITCTGEYVVTQADASAGSVTNTATATGQANGTRVESPPDSVTLEVQSGPGIRLEKSADDNHVYRAGDEVIYTYTVTNTGPRQLTGVAVTDDRVTGVTCETTTLAPAGQPGDSTTCTGRYTITDADASAGSVTNTATATGQANGTRVESPPDDITLLVSSELGLRLEKSADTGRVYEAGDEVTYTYRVTNTGNAELTDIAVTDELVPDVTCEATTLAPGASTTCTGRYTITDADAARGTVVNLAAASGRSGGTRVESPPDSVTLRARAERGLRLTKTVDGSRRYRVGQTVTYTYTVTNTGSTELTDIDLADDRVTGVTCRATTLAPAGQPGDSIVCTGRYRITWADAKRGEVVNVAVATADGGAVRSNQARARIAVEKKPCHGKHCPKPKPKPCKDPKSCHVR